MYRAASFVLAFLVVSSAYSQSTLGTYLLEFETAGDPLAIAVDSNGGVYYTVFTFAGPNQTRCYYVADPLTVTSVESHVLVDDAADTEVVAGRGFTGVAVDSQGNVFLALESGSADTATVRKLSPAPDFQPVADFFDGVVVGGKRYNGVELMDDDTLILSTFNTIEFWDANDSVPLHVVTGLEAYQRDVAFNPTTNEIYAAKNGGDSSNSVNRLSGGSADDPTAYTEITNGFIAQGGVNSTYGVNSQLIEYDGYDDMIYVPDYSAEQAVIAAYHSADPSAPVAMIDGSESPNGPLGDPADCAATVEFIFITDNANQRILVYGKFVNDVDEWNLY
ncbi:MAG: hypothetical protein P9L94_04275 [Candidatus Hinthialibacter antarcticus]|nr:hypothetical protein [Candidatus Hinthialibacter antarcticus]